MELKATSTRASLFPDVNVGDSYRAPARAATPPADRPVFLEFFAGSGLVAQGLKNVFRPVWANDNCAKKADVYAHNHGPRYFHLDSIANVKGKHLPTADMAWASFPCQDLSLAGLLSGIDGKRSGLVWEWLRVIDETRHRPPVLVAENVVGLLSADNGSHYRTLHAALVSRGYRVGAMVLDAERWVPQSRPRVFVVAVDERVKLPAGLLSDGPTWAQPDIVCKVADGLEKWVWWKMPEPSRRKVSLSDIIEWDAPFSDPVSDKRNIALLSERHAEKLRQVSEHRHFAAPGYKRTRDGKQVLELRFDSIAGCLRTPSGGSSRQLLVIAEGKRVHSRLLTARETARLMGAPDSYWLPQAYNDAYKAMGDAVAAPVARWLGKKLLEPLAIASRIHVRSKT
ncbi:DNA cytosine methyltransferase [Caballeronia sordidicola]|nr:DNA cytosine methyltransferase [Caballeronia sordidicola]